MIRRLTAIAGCASALAAIDLAAKDLWPPPPDLFHQRSTAWILASFVLLICCVVLALRSSPLICAAAATCAGGLVGNLVSAMTHGGRIPDPFLLGGTDGIAFNPADVFFVLGISGIVCASLQRVVCAARRRPKPHPERGA
jgi:Signal peptidase (SPase) II